MKLTHKQANAVAELLDAATNVANNYSLRAPMIESIERLQAVVDEANVAFGSLPKSTESDNARRLRVEEEYDAAG